MTKETLIRDIPSIQEILRGTKNFKNIKDFMPLLRPLLRPIGINTVQIDDALAKTEELEKLAEELSFIPDRFNDLFASRGWIIYEFMNFEVVQSAIKKGEIGDIDGAETDLVNYYDPETVRWNLKKMLDVQAFHARMPLAQKALIDYIEARYHACVPVVLALLDGLVNELHQPKQGFFAKNVNLEAWDSIAAHSKGLCVLTNIFKTGRYKTTTDQIFIPYRHGILHGMDLGYDNKMVAAKTWAALFATRDWAVKAEQGLIEPPPTETPETWGNILQQIRKNRDEKEQLEKWKPRTLKLGQNVPPSDGPEDFESGTPEKKLAEFLSYWRAKNYGFMARCLLADSSDSINAMAARVRKVYDSKHLQSFEFTEINDSAPAVTMIQVKLVYEEYDEVERSVQFSMINKDAKGEVSIRGTPRSSWFVMNWDTV